MESVDSKKDLGDIKVSGYLLKIPVMTRPHGIIKGWGYMIVMATCRVQWLLEDQQSVGS